MFVITKDHSDDPRKDLPIMIQEMPLFGIERAMGETGEIPNMGPTVRFRMWDDDDNLCYSGVLTDDEECLNQVASLRWGEADVGATRIKVLRDGEWKEEIS